MSGMDNSVFLRLPHIFKPLQTLNAVLLFVCVSSTGGSDNGIIIFVVVLSFLISLAATVIFALGVEDSLLDKITNRALSWNVVEMVYSFVIGVLCAISVWIAFGLANSHLGGASAGYIATGLFLIVQTALYAVPGVLIYEQMKADHTNQDVEAATPYPYQ